MSYRGLGAAHSQRSVPKPKPLPASSNTAWMSDFIPHLEGLTTPLTTESLLVLPLGKDANEREQRLRQLARMGILHMQAVRVGLDFSHYEWRVV